VTQGLRRLEARAARNRSLAKKLEQPTKPSRVNGRSRFPHHCRARSPQDVAPLPRLCRARSPERYRAVPGLPRPRNCRARSPEGHRAVPVILSFPPSTTQADRPSASYPRATRASPAMKVPPNRATLTKPPPSPERSPSPFPNLLSPFTMPTNRAPHLLSVTPNTFSQIGLTTIT
jgi:hypothetical protein